MINKEYFKALTGYRAIAAFMIFSLHNKQLIFSRDSFGFSFLSGFGIGVPLFFALSGFLIYTRYNTAEISAGFYKKYMVNRIARIYPVYFLLTTVTLLFNYKAAALSAEYLKLYFLNISFLRGYFEKYCFSLVATGWSLTVEETFYVIAPLIFALALTSIRKYILIFSAIFAFGWLMSFISVDLLNGFFWTDHKFMVLNTFFGSAMSFVVGIIVGVLNNRVAESKFKYFTIAGVAGLIVSLVFMALLPNKTGEDGGHSWPWIIINNFVAIPFVGALIWGLLREKTLFARLLSTETFQVLGKSSYTFYLVHYGILLGITNKFLGENVITHFVVFNIVSIVIWRLFEEPTNEWIRKKYSQLTSGSRPSPASVN